VIFTPFSNNPLTASDRNDATFSVNKFSDKSTSVTIKRNKENNKNYDLYCKQASHHTL
jgi:hypothetical protein